MKKIALFLTAFMIAALLCACQSKINPDTSVTTTELQETEAYFVAKVVELGICTSNKTSFISSPLLARPAK